VARTRPIWKAPPQWPTPPEGWRPPRDWQPDSSWPPPPEDWVWWELPAPSLLRRARAFLARLSALLALVIVVSTLLPGAPWLPTWLVFALFASVFPLFGSLVLQGAADQEAGWLPKRSFFDPRRERPPWQQPPQRIPGAPRQIWVAIGSLIAVLFFVGGSGMYGNLGQPEVIHGRYYADEHGSLTPLTRQQYDHQVALTQRWFGGGTCTFLLVVTGLTWRDLTTRRRGSE
jgi:hypothetical protein